MNIANNQAEHYSLLSDRTLAVVATQFDDDLDETLYVARLMCVATARPPEWARELIGPPNPGCWKDAVSYRFH